MLLCISRLGQSCSGVQSLKWVVWVLRYPKRALMIALSLRVCALKRMRMSYWIQCWKMFWWSGTGVAKLWLAGQIWHRPCSSPEWTLLLFCSGQLRDPNYNPQGSSAWNAGVADPISDSPQRPCSLGLCNCLRQYGGSQSCQGCFSTVQRSPVWRLLVWKIGGLQIVTIGLYECCNLRCLKTVLSV